MSSSIVKVRPVFLFIFLFLSIFCNSFLSLFSHFTALEALGVNPDEVSIPDLEAFDKSTFVNYM
jgi:hypothetical protein